MMQEGLSVAGLGHIADELNGFESVIVVDDIAKAQTPYARLTTVTALAELCYGHSYHRLMADNVYNIENFQGSAIVNVQPVLLRHLVESDEWEASIQDKTIRYYHLWRPTKPNSSPPNFKLQWGKKLEAVKEVTLTGRASKELATIGEIQWTRARQNERIKLLLRACAALDNRDAVNTTDYHQLTKILRPLMLERLILDKRDFESDRLLDANALAILTEFLTYGNFTLENLAYDYKVSRSQCYKLMSKYSRLWTEVSKSPTIYAPTAELKAELIRLRLIKDTRG